MAFWNPTDLGKAGSRVDGEDIPVPLNASPVGGVPDEDAADAGFDDQLIYDELPLPYAERRIVTETLLRDEAQVVFDAWKGKGDKVAY